MERGGSGDPSPMTAWGVFAACAQPWPRPGFGEELCRRAGGVQGAGHVGAAVARHLLEAGAG